MFQKKGMLEKLRQPIKRYTLHELAQSAHTYPWQEVCQTLRKQDKRLRLIEQEKTRAFGSRSRTE